MNLFTRNPSESLAPTPDTCPRKRGREKEAFFDSLSSAGKEDADALY